MASHVKSPVKGKHTTTPEHMPKAHREYAEWSSERIISQAATIGGGAVQVAESILSRRSYPEHGFAPAWASSPWVNAIPRSG